MSIANVKVEPRTLLSDLDLSCLYYGFCNFLDEIVAYFRRKLILSNMKNMVILLDLSFKIYRHKDFIIEDDIKNDCLQIIKVLKEVIEITEQRLNEAKQIKREYAIEFKEYYEKILYYANAVCYILDLKINKDLSNSIGDNFFNYINSDTFSIYEFGKGLYEGSKVEL
ncbi:hypothetical protein [Campylobacter sp. RM12651]|uniref:hypothetical protein n=1 Tax=Campylobacter sp. RM12651 TaxID=1660079 RepID=UPI001EFB74EC|nr:hypothetical protein [Campylobacter sp. RM12651]ULO03800.1 hypothetical protein AVBRAN_1346 [Campylobacter sp. RM12651]